MMKKSLFKNNLKSIYKTRRRFISILVMAFLGVGFFAGLVATSPDMLDSLDKYADSSNLYDINIISTLGLTDDDITALQALDGVENAYGIQTKDSISKIDDKESICKVIEYNENVNTPVIVAGRNIENENECLIDPAVVRTGEGAERYIGKKIVLEKRKEKIIIRDPEHSQSKFLTGIIKVVLLCIKIMAIFFGIGFAFSFVGLVALLVLSFLFVKTGLVFFGSLLGIISALIINFVILQIIYNFIVSKKNHKTRIAILLISSLVLAGLSIGMIFIGATSFNVVEEDNIEAEDEYNIQMTDNLSIGGWDRNIEYVESDLSDVKIVTGKAKISSTALEDEIIKAYNEELKSGDIDAGDRWQQSTNGTDGLYYRDIEISCIVLAENSFKGTLKNIAEIQEDKAVDEQGNEISKDDRDSTPDNVDTDNYIPPTDNSSYQEDDDDYCPDGRKGTQQ